MMPRSGYLWILWVSLLGYGAAAAGADETALTRFQQARPHMGTQFGIALYAPDAETASKAFEAAFSRIGELDDRLSDYDATSELSRLSGASPTQAPVPISKDLWKVLAASQKLSRRTDGAFDVTVGPLTSLWRNARREKELPDDERLKHALTSTGYEHLRLHKENRTAELLRPGMRLDLGAIAKGYACDEALAAMSKLHVTRALVNGGGGMAIGDLPPGEKGWSIGVAPLEPEAEPSQVLVLANCGVATSGDAWQYVELGGVRYSHIVDPQTGLGMTTRSSVTVVAPTGMQADGLATAASVLGPEKGLELIDQTPGAAAVVVWVEEGETKSAESKRFEELPTE
ncbi:MAG: FAD:protein FMN transferase [Planctomycetes bacterium]|nr:FAD:protein FMN transferase [Planctomycetota bacterium]